MTKKFALSALLLCGASALTLAQTPALPAGVATRADLMGALGGSSGNATSVKLDVLLAHAGADRVSVDVLRRVRPEEGPVVHEKVTEVYQIIDGGGTIETGGTLVDPKPMVGKDGKPTNPANIGPSMVGSDVKGGQSRTVGVGDIILIAPGVPHRFTQLNGSVTYSVVRFNPGYFKGQN